MKQKTDLCVYAKILYEQLGTIESPNPKRHEFLNFIQSYKEAKEKIDFLSHFKLGMAKFPTVSAFTFDTYYQSDDEGGSYLSASVSGITNTNGKILKYGDNDFKDVVDELTDFIYNMPESLKESLAGEKMSLGNFEKIKQKALDANEKVAFDMVENFERNLLNKETPQTDKLKKQLKI